MTPPTDDVIREVDSVIASAALDGRTISPEWRETLIRIASGELDVEGVLNGIRAELARTPESQVG